MLLSSTTKPRTSRRGCSRSPAGGGGAWGGPRGGIIHWGGGPRARRSPGRAVGWAQCVGRSLAAVLCTGAAVLWTAATAVAATAAAGPALPAAASSALSLGPRGMQTLVVEQLFNRKGRWYLSDDDGICYT